MTGVNLPAILRHVPEKKLHVFDLAEALRNPDGTLNLDDVGRREAELKMAEHEADLYAIGTRRVVNAIRTLFAE